MALECTFGSLSKVDQTDPEAVQALLQSCVDTLLSPSLWGWAIALTLICAVIGALIGRSKGRWLAGFVWGAALGPIGWIVIAVSKREPRLCPVRVVVCRSSRNDEDDVSALGESAA